ncbi:MAG: factor-independent urate hydroxylase [Chloroflexota bacterium]
MNKPKLTIQQVNALDHQTFVDTFGFLFEGSPWIARDAEIMRPFASVADMHDALCKVMYEAAERQQLALIRAHPDLVGRAARAGTLTPESTGEQAAAGLDSLSPAEIATFERLNAAYKEKFAFPFVICARENKKESILAGFDSRLNNTQQQEIQTALNEIAKIARLRLLDVTRGDLARSTDTQFAARSNKGAIDLDAEISYGKGQISLYRTYASEMRGVPAIPESAFTGKPNTLFALEVDVEVLGDNFMPAYTEGDNSNVVATDTMKNFVLGRALEYQGATPEGFLDFLGHRFLDTYPQMQRLRLTAREQPFEETVVPSSDGFGLSNLLFSRSHNSYGMGMLEMERDANGPVVTGHKCGCVGLQLIKVTGSSFASFVRDQYTTLPERPDRPLFIHLDVFWKYSDPNQAISLDLSHYIPTEQVRDFVGVVFHDFVSMSIQHLLHEMGIRLLERFPQMVEISFQAQNRLWDTAVESQENPKLKVYTDPRPPYGMIRLTLSRE